MFQIEYAVAAIDNAAPAVGVLAKDGIVIAGEKKVLSKLLATPKSSEKMATVDEHVVCAVAGLTSGETCANMHNSHRLPSACTAAACMAASTARCCGIGFYQLPLIHRKPHKPIYPESHQYPFPQSCRRSQTPTFC